MGMCISAHVCLCVCIYVRVCAREYTCVIFVSVCAGNHVVFVINHPYESGNPEDRIEKFVYDPKTQELRHQTYFSDPTMVRSVSSVFSTVSLAQCFRCPPREPQA